MPENLQKYINQELTQQIDRTNVKIDSLSNQISQMPYTLSQLMDDKLTKISTEQQRDREKLHRLERRVAVHIEASSQNLQHQQGINSRIGEETKQNAENISMLWKIENQRKGKLAVIVVIASFCGAILSAVTISLITKYITQ